MATLALRLQVFVSSPSDVQEERNTIERVVAVRAREVSPHGLLLNTYRFEADAMPAFGRPLDQSNEELSASELVVAVLGKGVGTATRPYSPETGTLEELRLAQAMIDMGRLDNLFLYYRSEMEATTPVETIRNVVEPIMDSRKQTLWAYRTTEDLAVAFDRHLSKWIGDWRGIPAICRHALEGSSLLAERDEPLGENRLELIENAIDVHAHTELLERLGRLCVSAYQAKGRSAATMALPEDAMLLSPLVHEMDGGIYLAHPEYFFFLCAIGLSSAILADDTRAVQRYPYVNQVHQYLKALIQRRGLDVCSATLCAWLSRRAGPHPSTAVTRNFAAYVLGMIGAKGAENQLADALENDDGTHVKTYCITSLAKLRSRRYMGLLRRHYENSRDSAERLLIAKAMCRLVGVANFEL